MTIFFRRCVMKINEMRFYQLLKDFLTDYLTVRRNLSDKTARTYRQSLNQFVRYLRDEKEIRFDSVGFACFSRSSVYEFLIWLRDFKGCCESTLNLRLAAIKSFLKYCGEEDFDLMAVYLDVASIHAFKKAKKAHVEYLTQPQLKQLFSTPDVSTRLGRRDRLFLILAYETGARMQEMLDLKCGCIICDGDFAKIRIYGKGAKVRYVPLMKSVMGHLDAYMAEFHPSPVPGDFLFYTIHDSKHTQMKPGTVDHFLKKYGGKAHAKDESFPPGLHAHMLRHSVAMTMYKKGIPISYIKDFLGHVSLDTTAIYSYADEETIAKALEAIEHEPADKKPPPTKKWKDKEQYLLNFCGLS
jgi:site-specific recombinase XerD